MRARCLHVLAAAACIAVALPSIAQALVDPTRPPNALGTPAAPGVAAPADTVPSASVLQSILLSPHRRLAWIDGRSVEVGDRVGEASVVAIEVDSVKLRGDDGALTVMRLMPDVQISRSSRAAAPSATRPRGEPR
jgi:MSHA biogenesis protein MshK